MADGNPQRSNSKSTAISIELQPEAARAMEESMKMIDSVLPGSANSGGQNGVPDNVSVNPSADIDEKKLAELTASGSVSDGGQNAGSRTQSPQMKTPSDDDNEEPDVIERFWNAVMAKVKSYMHIVKYVVLGVALVGWLVYLGFAFWCRFGDEESVRMLVITVVAIAWIANSKISQYTGCYSLFKRRFCGPKVCRILAHPAIPWSIMGAGYIFVLGIVAHLIISGQRFRNLVGIIGIAIFIGFGYLVSHRRKRINWRVVCSGLLLQGMFAVLILRFKIGFEILEWMGHRVDEFMKYSDAGARFVFGDGYHEHLVVFAISSIIIFFSSILAVCYYFGIAQWLIRRLAWFLSLTMGTSPTESFAAASNIFLGHTEACMMLRPVLALTTQSELHAILASGMATVAGTVLALYISLGIPAPHLLSASIMAAPGSLVIAKLFYPETQTSLITDDYLSTIKDEVSTNVIHALSMGALTALEIVGGIVSNFTLSFELLISYVLWPVALVMGVDPIDCRRVAELVGLKITINEFVAYTRLRDYMGNRAMVDSLGPAFANHSMSMEYLGEDIMLRNNTANTTSILHGGVLQHKSEMMATYALCGFSNLGALGILIGAVGAMVPTRRADISRLVLRALVAGNIACFMTATIAGIFYQGQPSLGRR